MGLQQTFGADYISACTELRRHAFGLKSCSVGIFSHYDFCTLLHGSIPCKSTLGLESRVTFSMCLRATFSMTLCASILSASSVLLGSVLFFT